VVSGPERDPTIEVKINNQPLENTVQPGDKVFVKVFRRKWYNERREGPFEVVRSTGTAVQVKGSPTWYHLSHCVKIPSSSSHHRKRRNNKAFSVIGFPVYLSSIHEEYDRFHVYMS
uniref:Murine leukemia virus integrase C-terminal domain-containing protein n=1 Tax=Seriola lalandi dorsalis TaxID=1841481 RepID=A0A3B4X5E9_SERLL